MSCGLEIHRKHRQLIVSVVWSACLILVSETRRSLRQVDVLVIANRLFGWSI